MIKKRVWELPNYELPLDEGKVLVQTENSSYSLNLTALISGLSDANYVHTQTGASSTWVVNHNLSKFPSVTIVDSAGTRVFGDEEYVSPNQVILRFGAAFGGKAYCN